MASNWTAQDSAERSLLFRFMGFFLGIDGGGTRTTAWVGDAGGRVLGRGEAGPSNPVKAGLEDAQREILRAARRAVRRARIGWTDIEALCLGLAGAGNPALDKRISHWLRRAIPARRYLLTTDGAIALVAAFGDGPGIVVVSGTGSIAYARDERGRVVRAGGWGNVFGDEGSGYDIARRAIAAALGAADGRSGKTSLGKHLARSLGLDNISEAVSAPLSPNELAGLFPVVLEAARRGDRVARMLCLLAGHDLGELALALIARLGWKRKRFTVACAGGVLHTSARIRAAMARTVRATAPRARITLLRREPVEGALELARILARAEKAR